MMCLRGSVWHGPPLPGLGTATGLWEADRRRIRLIESRCGCEVSASLKKSLVARTVDALPAIDKVGRAPPHTFHARHSQIRARLHA